jgi:hypothetical protein
VGQDITNLGNVELARALVKKEIEFMSRMNDILDITIP